MSVAEIKSCHIGPEISPEQFIPEHIFFYLAKGAIEGYDGKTKHEMKSGDYCVLRKNHLARYSKEKDEGQFEKVVVIFDEAFLRKFKHDHQIAEVKSGARNAFYSLEKNELIPNFIKSLMPYYKTGGEIDEAFSKVKREELLLILLRADPALAGLFFDFSIPEKLDLEVFINKNYKFNVNIERLAYLTGRSISAFKRDFKKIFQDTPNRWLMQRRLQEAHFQIEKHKQKPSAIYLDLGFENLSHFSFAFKKRFGYNPSNLLQNDL